MIKYLIIFLIASGGFSSALAIFTTFMAVAVYANIDSFLNDLVGDGVFKWLIKPVWI